MGMSRIGRESLERRSQRLRGRKTEINSDTGKRSNSAEVEPDRKLYPAVHQEVYVGLFEEAIGKLLLKNHRASLLVFDLKQEEIVKWIP